MSRNMSKRDGGRAAFIAHLEFSFLLSLTQEGNSRFLLYLRARLDISSQLRSFIFSARFHSYSVHRAQEETRLVYVLEERETGMNIERILISHGNQNNCGAWFCYLHSKYKPIIAIKFAIKYRIRMRWFPITAHNASSFTVENCSKMIYFY